MCEQGKEDEKVRNLLDAFSFRTEQRPRPRSIRGDKMGTPEEEQRVPGVPEALYSLGTRGIRGLPLAGALSRRHVCFSVVKRAAGRQTGLNQPLPPPPPSSPPSTASSTSSAFSLALSPLLARPRCPSLFLSRPIFLRSSIIPLSFRVLVSRAGRAPPDQESVRWVTNCFLFERTN